MLVCAFNPRLVQGFVVFGGGTVLTQSVLASRLTTVQQAHIMR